MLSRYGVIAAGVLASSAGVATARFITFWWSHESVRDTCNHALWRAISRVSKWYRSMQKLRRAQRIILIRHGESEGNINTAIYESVPDCNLKLTDKGEEQARKAGKELAGLIGDDLTCFYISPYTRAQQTLAIMLQAAHVDPKKIMVRLEPRLREQDFGNLQQQHSMQEYKQVREKVGLFYYRFREGESGADANDRVTLFMETLFRELHDWTRPRWKNVVLVCHGLTMRLFIMRYMNWSVDDYCRVWNPANGSILILEKCPITNSYILVSDLEYGDERACIPPRLRRKNQWNWDHGQICKKVADSEQLC